MSISLASASQQYSKGSHSIISDYPFTMAGWFKATSTHEGSVLSINVSDSPANYEECATIYCCADNYCALWLDTSGGSGQETLTSTQYSTGVWYHLCGVFTSSTSRTIYLNAGGNQTGTNDKAFPAATDRISVGVLGSDTHYGNYFNGLLAYVALWSTALSAGEVSQLAGGAYPSSVQAGFLEGYWPLVSDDDDDANSYDLAEVNAPSYSGDNPTMDSGGSVVPILLQFRRRRV